MRRDKNKIQAILFAVAIAVSTTTVAADSSETKIAALFESSFAHEATGNIKNALNDTLNILRMNASHYIANYRVAWLYYLQGRYSESIQFYKKACSIKPNAIEPELALLLPLMASRRWSEAEKLALQVLKKAPANYLGGSRLAYIYFSQGKYKLALAQYKEVLDNYPSEIEMMLGLGWTYLKIGQKAEARKMFLRVLSIRRQNVNARAGLEAL